MTTTDPAPDVPRKRQRTGDLRPSTTPAWCAVWDLMDDGSEHARPYLISVMREASPISYLTAREVLNEAVRSGRLVVVSRDQYARPTLKRSDR